MSKAPEKIYLQTCEGEFHDDVTWCADHINDTDTAYVRGDISYGYASEVERLRDVTFRLAARIESLEFALGRIEKHAAVLTAHGIETMARDALTKEG